MGAREQVSWDPQPSWQTAWGGALPGQGVAPLCPGQRGCHGEGSILAPMLTSWVPLRKALALQATILSSVQWVASPLPARPRVRIQ